MLKNKGFNLWLNEIDIAMDQTNKRVATKVMNRAKKLTPVRGGYLKSRWVLKKIKQGIYHITNDAPYAGFVETGTANMEGRHMLKTAVAEHRIKTR
jgi:HK97 gp10 family phage protein